MVKQPKSPARRVKSENKRPAPSRRSKSPANDTIRLNKYLAECGVCSRRKADELIEEGAIKLNGKSTYEMGVKVNPKTDKVMYRGKLVTPPNRLVYYAFNKPKSVVTSTSDPMGRPTVSDYFKKIKLRLFPVGRLDWDAEGLLLMTNDGDFAQEVIHPRQGVVKTYHVKLKGVPNPEKLDKLRRGVSIIGGKVSAVFVKRLPKSTDTRAWIEIGILEGKNHQVKKMFEKIGFDVIKLRRVAIGGLKIGLLKTGQYKELKSADLARIFGME